MWYVYREYPDGEIAEDCYNTLQEARRAQLFITEHFDADEVTLSTTPRISPFGGRDYKEPKIKSKPASAWLSWLLKPFMRNRVLSR